VTTFYAKKDEVKLKPGQTLGFTAGRGYYAAGAPALPKPPPSLAAKAASDKSSVAPTATRPVAAKTPASPQANKLAAPRAAVTDPPPDDTTGRGNTPLTPSRPSPPKVGESTPLYTRPGDVPLQPGQSVASTAANRYYAAGRPNPTKAATKPTPSHVNVMAVSTKASTISPLLQRRSVGSDGSISIRLQHLEKTAEAWAPLAHERPVEVTDRSVRPSTDAMRVGRTTVGVKQASTLIHEQINRAKQQSRDPDRYKQKHRPQGLPTRATVVEKASLFTSPPRRPHERSSGFGTPLIDEERPHHHSYATDRPRPKTARPSHPSTGRGLNVTAEVAYANKYAKDDNPAYEVQAGDTFSITIFGHTLTIGGAGDDCTDFVSQALRAAGWRPDKLWQDPSYPIYGVAGVESNPTPAWVNVHDFLSYAVSQHGAKWVSRSDVKPGDIIAADWSGGRGAKFDPSHLMIVTAVTKTGQIYVAEHSNNRVDFPLYGPGHSDTIEGKARQANNGKTPSFEFLRP